jgi:hypothetical protein
MRLGGDIVRCSVWGIVDRITEIAAQTTVASWLPSR